MRAGDKVKYIGDPFSPHHGKFFEIKKIMNENTFILSHIPKEIVGLEGEASVWEKTLLVNIDEIEQVEGGGE